ncbi:MAG: sodium:proton antiporter NhaD [Schleiferiaceae bacterium]|jgi:Na+/H+ antiporter NhaD/arsenite permease-like protein|nr:sodium:proton antiporter NhaD [Schleiferiaceae bacterium]MDP4627571.1 sodium:proton antiporter NhaD [Schleiferiaceae bacterium]MDP4728332.1 sodium:proton antiporter NhaD [Schleiferiaceae bacterium]MDP4749128.1 sodium:proton antiporter NhaD [Schleiferiaceae bacterium]MDP4858658.1 sodium:proton antiporter NhaD [Schleiferiaceae bacterium]
MIYGLLIAIFVLGYAAIVFEHNLKIDKAAAALVTGVLCWTVYIIGGADIHHAEHLLLEHVSEIAGILFFLLGAMTIVELVDAHEGFSVITSRLKTKNPVVLLWSVALLTFFLSAVLDNLTTSIVMISLLRKLVKEQNMRWTFAGIVVIAANSGGAWSPIGDVTTTMLWIGQQITAGEIVGGVFFTSLVSMLIPVTLLSFTLKGTLERPESTGELNNKYVTDGERKLVLVAGVAGLLLVPVFKTVTHLPPFMGMMFSLGVLWLITDLIHRKKAHEHRQHLGVIHTLRKIDTPSVLFFLGILLAVAALQAGGQLTDLAKLLDAQIGTSSQNGVYLVGGIIGVLSAIIDNVPLVAAAMGMYPIELDAVSYFAVDGLFWEYLAYTAGTGGSILIIGSAAGVAVMGLEKIPFGWYLKRISGLALIGYLGGIGAYLLQQQLGF